LAKPSRKWEYIFTLQVKLNKFFKNNFPLKKNHDVQLKSNEEMVQIFKWLNGTNDIQFEFEHHGPQGMIAELHKKHNWTFQHLNLFKNGKFTKMIII
jgi:hypothetical protein